MITKKIFLTFVVIFAVFLSACERAQQMTIPDSVSTDPDAAIKIGVIQPSGFATGFTKGAKLAGSQINNTGGLLGRQVEFIVMDNQGTRLRPSAEESIRIAKTLVEAENVVAILGPIFSTNSVQVGPVATQLGYPLITGSSGRNVTATGKFVFIVASPVSLTGALMARFALDTAELGAKSAATLRQDQDVHSSDLTLAFEDSFRELRGSLVASEIYQQGDRSFDAQLAHIKDLAPDVLLIAGFNPEVPLIVAQARNIGITATFLGSAGWDEPDKLFNTLEDNAPLEGSYLPRNFSTEAPETAPFVTAYQTAYMELPTDQSARGYDAMSLLALAIKNAGTLEPEAVREALTNITDYQGATTISHFDENRHPVRSLALYTIRNGQIERYKVVQPSNEPFRQRKL